MSELEINTPTKEIPDALKAQPVVDEEDKEKEEKPVEQQVAIDSELPEKKEVKPEIKANTLEDAQPTEAGVVGFVKGVGKVVGPLVGVDAATQAVPPGITTGKLSPEAQKVADDQDRISSLSYEDFKQGVLNNSITEYKGTYFDPVQAEDDGLLDYYEKEIGLKQETVGLPSGETITGTTEVPTPYANILARDFEDRTKDENKAISESKILKLLTGTFKNVDPLADKRLKSIMARRINTTEFLPVVQERLREIGRGTLLEFPALLEEYVGFGMTVFSFDSLREAKKYQNAVGGTFGDAWDATKSFRDKKVVKLRNYFSENFGLKQLSDVMNEMIVEDLKSQVGKPNGISQERFNQLTVSPTGGKIKYVDEQTAQDLLEISFESLSEPEQFGAIGLETFVTMFGLGGKTQAGIKKASKTQIEDVQAKMKNSPFLAKMGIAGAAYHLKTSGDLKNLNLNLIRDGLHVRKNESYFKRIDNQISSKEDDLITLGYKSGTDTKEYRSLEREIIALKNQRFRNVIKLGTLPILKENIKESFPMGLYQYFIGEHLSDSDYGISQFEGEGYAALSYILGGGFLIKGGVGYVARKGRDFASAKIDVGGSQKRNFLNFLETNKVTTGFVNFIKNKTGYDLNPRGLLTNASLEQYNEKLLQSRGIGLTKQERQNANYVLELASVMSDDNLTRVLNSITKLTTIETKFVKSFPKELQEEAANVFRLDLSTTTQIGALEAAGALVTNKINMRKLRSYKKIDEYMDIDSLNREQLRKNALAIEGLKKKLAESGQSLDDNKMANGYIETLEAANEKFIRRLDNQLIELDTAFKKARKILFEDPTADVPESLHTLMDSVSSRVRAKLTRLEGIGEEAFEVEQEAKEISNFMKVRFKKLRKMKEDGPSFLRASGLYVEEFITHQLYKIRDSNTGAARGFPKVNELAAKKNVQINLGDAVIDLWKRAGETDIQAFFSPSGALFAGILGKKSKTVFERMADRAMENIPEKVKKEIFDMASNPKNVNKDFYAGENPSNLEVALAFMKYYDKNNIPIEKRKFAPFMASPSDVNEMHSAFVEFGVRTKNERLAAEYIDYGSTLKQLIRDQDEEVADAYDSAKEIYQSEWFDRIRTGPLAQLLKSREGPLRVSGKKEPEAIFESMKKDETYDREGFKILTNDNVFKFAYKGNINPITVFKPLTDKITKAAKDGDTFSLADIQNNLEDLMQNFGDRISGKAGFDLTTDNGKRNFQNFRDMLSVVIRATYATDAMSQIDFVQSNPFIRKSLKDSGNEYNFKEWQNLEPVSKMLKFRVKEIDPNTGKPVVRMKQVLDLEDLVIDQKDIVGQMDKYPELQRKYQKEIIEEFDNKKEVLLQEAKTDNKIEDLMFRGVKQTLGRSLDYKSFYTEYVTNGTPEKLADLKNTILKELSGTGADKISSAERAVFEKKINEGILQMIIKGQLEEAGMRNVKGLGDTDFVDIDRLTDEGTDKDMFIDPVNNLLDKFKSKKGIDGNMYPIKVITKPEDLLDSIKNPNKREIFEQFMDKEHIEYYENMLEYMVMTEKGDFSKVKLEGLTRGITTNEAISRAFNLARGMVSPTYVAAEFAVRIAEMSGIQLLGMVGRDKEAARILVDMFKVGVKPSSRDVGTLANKITSFVFKEMARMGITPPEHEIKTQAELDAEIEKYKKQMISKGDE